MSSKLGRHQYYLLHKDRLIEQSRQYNLVYRSVLKPTVLGHYSGGETPRCARCGVDDIDILTIDHISGNGNEHRRRIGVTSGWHFYEWLKRNDFPDGYQVLCFNCNMKKQMVGRTTNEKHTID